MRWQRPDPARALRAFVLIAWAVFLVRLVATGEVVRYIGPRTEWVVVFGALAVTAVAAGYLLTIRERERSALGTGDLWGAAILLAPILVVTAIPAPSLGSLAASKKLSGGPVTAGIAQPAPDATGVISFPDIEYASESTEYAASRGIADGTPVELTGFVTKPPDLPAGEFALTRFAIYCCAADVVPHSVPVDPGGEYLNYNVDRWLRVRGALEERDGVFVLVARDVVSIEEPTNPYIR